MYGGSWIEKGSSSSKLGDVILCGTRPCCVARIVLAIGDMKHLMALADTSSNPRPPSPVGVVAMHHA